ncbi:30S ribosomal protein S4 [bacterium]|nr:30S ribosomal protein S4 [bacterium]
MTKRVESKYKVSRRYGVSLWGRAKDPVNKRDYGPGQHGPLRRRKTSDYGLQLKEKQKMKHYYGNISERQFRNIYKEAMNLKGDNIENLIGLLESRLDVVVYRMNLVPTVFSARQFVNHGHIRVNGKKVNIPSYRVQDGDVVELKDKSREIAMVISTQQNPERSVPEYITLDGPFKGTYTRRPKLAEVPYPVVMEPNLVIEYYSR